MAIAPPLKLTVPSVGPRLAAVAAGGGFEVQLARTQMHAAVSAVVVIRCIAIFPDLDLSSLATFATISTDG